MAEELAPEQTRKIKEIGRQLLTSAIAIGVAATSFLSNPSKAEAGIGGCAGWKGECNGKDPMGLCDSDAQTVASVAISAHETNVYLGQLELRYSDSCKANWGRFSMASGPRELIAKTLDRPRATNGRVTVWNPGSQSYGVVGKNALTYWSAMTDGSKAACTGVEAYSATGYSAPDTKSNGWTWGPCV